MAIIHFQPEFRPALPCVFGAKDYREFRSILIEMDRILSESGAELRLIRQKVEAYEKPLDSRQVARHVKTLRLALRYSILLAITGLSYRELACRVADSHLFQWFTYTGFIDAVRPVSKSTIERFEKLFAPDEVAELIHALNQAATERAGAVKLLYREAALEMDHIFADTTCVKADIHFPADWVLLRDAARTLVQAIVLIREQGLRHRIRPPEELLREMNKLCIEMTHTRKKKDAKKMRKTILRRMKKLMKTIEGHARNYRALLITHYRQIGWSRRKAWSVLKRIKGILRQLPAAITQAHERIIGERRIDNAEKILSLYEPDVHVIVRGKAGAEVEFGNGLYLAEQADGLIVDWDFRKGQPPADTALVSPSLERITENHGTPASYATDRGFDSAPNRKKLEELGIDNAICPRSVLALEEKLEDETFCLLQKRRGSTEGRIGLFKNAYLGRPLRAKGYEHRKLRITWCILGHNLWKLATMAAQKKAEHEAETAAA